MIFITLIGIAAAIISQATAVEETDDVSDLSATCDILFEAGTSLSEIGYKGEDRLMRFTDICAISMMYGDGRAAEYLDCFLKNLYPWNESYSVELTYGTYELVIGTLKDGEDRQVEHSYPVEYGGNLVVRLTLHM